MATKSIMKRSTFTKRRKIIIYMVVCILILGIVAGFTDPFITDNTIHVAEAGQIIVMESEPPASGDPSQYDAISNLKYAAYKLHHAKYFRGVTDGTTVADLGITDYTQYVHNLRVSNGNGIVFAETISSSSLVSVAEQKYADHGIIIYRPSKSVSGSTAVFSDTAYQMSYADYGNKYGTVPDQLSKYIINEKTIIGVVDENAKTQPQANSARTSDGEEESEGAGFDFYVPENLVPDAEGNFTFTVTLDPTESSLYYRNEVRTLAGADQNPKFYAASVTVKIAPDWTPISVTTVENYDVAIPVLGAMNCTSNMLEVFYDVDIDDGVIPEREFFQPYVDNAKNDPSYVPPDIPEGNRSPADYLATAFADYISGERNLDLTVDINAAGIWAYDLILSLNIGTMDVRAMLGDLYVKYSGDKVNIKLNDINGYLNTADFASLIQNEQISALLSGLGDLSDFDIMSLFGGDMLGTVFSNCEMTTENGITRIHMPFALDISALGLGADAVDIDASIYIAEEDMSLRSITGEITLFGKKITIEAKPLTRLPAFPSTEGAVDLSGLLDFVPDILTLAQSKTFGISGTVTALGQTLDVSAYVDITDGIKADAVISAMGADVSVKYVDGTIYLGVGAIDVRGTASELMDLAAPLLGSVDINKYLNIIKLMLPSTVNDFVGMVKSLEVTPEKLTLGVNILTSPITLSLERAGGSITGLEFAFNFDMFGIKLDAAADLDITTPEARKIQLPSGEDYITFAQLAKLIEQVKPYLDAKAFDVAASGTVTASSKFDFTMGAKINLDETGVAASGSVTALGQALDIAYSGTTAYISLGNLKFKLDTNNIDAIADPIMNLLGIELPTVNIEELIPQALSAVKSLIVNDDGKVTAVLQMQDVDITAVIDLAAGTADICGTAMGVALSFEATVTPLGEQANVVLPDNTDEYIDLVKFVPTMKSVFGILETKSVSANMAFAMGDIAESALIELSFADGLKARITHAGLGLNITVIGETAYIALGDIRVVGSLNDVPALLDAIDPVLPDNVKQTIADVMGMLGNLPPVQDIIDIALAAVTSLTVDSTDALHATITYNDIAILLSASTDLSTVTANVAAGNNRIVVTLDGISSEEVTVSVPAGSYATLANITNIAKTIIPLTTEKSFGIALNNFTVLGTTLSGQVYIGTEGGIAVDANLMLADVAVRITVVGGKLYLSVGDSIRLTEQLTLEALQTLAAELEVYIPGITDMLGSLVGSVDISIPTVIQTVLDDVALYAHGENGITIDITVPDATSMAITLDTANGVLSTLSVTGSVLGEAIDVTMSVITNNGVLSGFACDNATVAGIAASLDIGISGAVARNVQPIADCISVNKLLSSVSQIAEVALAAANGNGVSLGFGTTAIQLGNTSITVSGSAQVSVTPLAAEATLTIALGGDEYALDVVYANGIIYVSHNDIKLQIDAANDVMPLYELIKNMLPAAVTDIVEVMLGNKQGETPFDGIMGIADSINGIVAQPTAQNILSTLLSYDEDNISLAKRLLGMIELSAFGNTSVTLGVTADDMHLDVTPYGNNATVRVDAMGIATSITLSDIVSETVTVSAPAGSYASLGAIVAAATPIMPLIDAAETGTAFELAINCALLSSPISSEGEKVQTPITGTVYIDLTNGLVLEARLTVGDLPIVMIIVDGNLYLSVNNNIKISETLTLESIKALVAQLDKVLPGIEKIVTELIDSIMNMTLHDLLGIIVLNQGADAGSFSVAIDLTDRVDIAAQIDISTDGSALDNIGINGALFGTEVSFALGYTGTTDDGTLNLGGKDITITSDKTDEATGKTEKTATVLELVLGIGVKRTEARTAPVKPIKDCIAISKLMDYLDPVLALVDDINKGVDTITLDLGAIALFTEDNSQINISGKVKVELSRGIKVRAELSLFDGTENAVALNITYVDSTVYVQLEKFLISLNTESDFQRLYDVIQNYLPTYINIEIAKLFGLKDVLEGLGAANSASAFSNLSLLIERLGDIATAESVDQAITLLFTSLNSLYSDSAIKSMLNLIVGLGLNEAEELTVSAEVMGITLNVTPHISPATAEKTASISSATVSVNLTDGITIKLMANGYKLSVAPDGQFVSDIFAPNDADKYLSVMDFVELINDAINTFTTFDPNGDITFKLDKFTFDYTIYQVETQKDEKGNEILDEDGNPIPVKENGRSKPLYDNKGNKVVDKTVNISTPEGKTALQGTFKRVEETNELGEVVDVSYRFNLEAHIVLDISSLTYSRPLLLDMYVVNQTGNGEVLLDYYEQQSKNGERIYIDYDSVMQMVAAVMDIIGVDDEVMETLLGDYRLEIDSTVFDSMDIVGLGDIKELINDAAAAIQYVIGDEGALGDIKAAWNLFYTAGDADVEKGIDVLGSRLEDALDEEGNVVQKGIMSYITDAVSKVMSAVELFGSSNPVQPEMEGGEQEITLVDGKVFHDIVTGVWFDKTVEDAVTTILANVSNEITTGTTVGKNTDPAVVSVAKVYSEETNRSTIDRIMVERLDVNTALLSKFDMLFTAGAEVSITLPAGYEKPTTAGMVYSNFANIKHLIFDVMNTANMLEFEIGDLTSDKTDYIDMNVLSILDVKIKYSIKVKIIDQGEGANPRYKTAVDVTLDIPKTSALGIQGLPDCVTRVFFYDNVLYVHGVSDWGKEWVKDGWIYKQVDYVRYYDAAYTLDELGRMLSADNGMDRLFKEIVFQVLPLTDKILTYNIHDSIIDAIKNPPEAAASLHTIAQIFKEYSYDTSTFEHYLKIGLKELTLNGSLDDAIIKFKGANDNDDNIFDNYVSSAYIETSFTKTIKIATLKLHATLKNVNEGAVYYEDAEHAVPSPDNATTGYYRNEIWSRGLNATNIDGTNYTFLGGNGNESIVDRLLAEAVTDENGTIIGLNNRPNGVQWNRPWAS